MNKTITDPMQVKVGDKAYFKGCDFGFTVCAAVGNKCPKQPFAVNNPLTGRGYWAQSQQFDYAIREVDEPEWPDPNDLQFHVYLGADGKRYIYNPCIEPDPAPWIAEGSFASRDRQKMASTFPEALPLVELSLEQKKD